MREEQEKLTPGTSLLFASALILCAVEMIAGLILGFAYSSSSLQAHAAVTHMHEGSLRPLQALHYWASSLLIVESIGLVATLAWLGCYRGALRVPFAASVLLALGSLGMQLTGNLLPFDRHGVQTAAIEAGIAARAPIIGSSLRQLTLHGDSFNATTNPFWYQLHWALTLVFIVTFAIVYLSKTAIFNETLNRPVLAAMALFPFLVALAVPSPFGTGATVADYEGFSDKASWYTWPLHGSLVMLDRLHSGWGWIGAILAPGLVVAGLIALPLIGAKVPTAVVRGSMILTACFFGAAAVFYGGSFAPLIGTRDPQELAGGPSTGKPAIDSALRDLGQKLFEAQGCGDCHGKDGLKGDTGPSLKNEWQRHPDREFYERYVRNPQSVNPQSTMPAFPKLTATELSQLAEFLRAPR